MPGRRRVIAGLLPPLAIAVAVSACAGPAPSEPPGPPGSAPGRVPERLIAVAPSIVEILFALDLGDRVVGVGDYLRWPPAAAAKPKIGGLFDPRFEEIVALAPDLAVLLPSEGRLAGELERLGVETLTVRHETLADIGESILEIASRTGVEDRGRRLAAELERDLAPRRRDPAPRVLLLVARERDRLAQLTAVGASTFLAEVLERMGAENVLADAGQPSPQINLETVLDRRPEVIVELQPGDLSAEDAAALVAEWRRFPHLPAVERGCVLLPGPRVPLLARRLEEALDACDEREAA